MVMHSIYYNCDQLYLCWNVVHGNQGRNEEFYYLSRRLLVCSCSSFQHMQLKGAWVSKRLRSLTSNHIPYPTDMHSCLDIPQVLRLTDTYAWVRFPWNLTYWHQNPEKMSLIFLLISLFSAQLNFWVAKC